MICPAQGPEFRHGRAGSRTVEPPAIDQEKDVQHRTASSIKNFKPCNFLFVPLPQCLPRGPLPHPFWLALFVDSVEPERPIRIAWIVPFLLGGLVAALGYLVVALAPIRVAMAVLELRLFVACLMALPCTAAVYLISVTDAGSMVLLCGTLLVATAWLLSACIYPAWLQSPQVSRVDTPA
jgi:hypothetical protein